MKDRDITFSWEEGRYFDLWMVVHILAGFTLGLLAEVIGFTTFTALLIIIPMLVLWEVGEYMKGVKEHAENQVIDVVVAIVAALVAIEWIGDVVASDTTFALFLFSSIMLGVLTLIGWLAYRRRKE